MATIKSLLSFIYQHYRRFLCLLYVPIYLFFFALLEHRDVASYHMLNHAIDDAIPFCEYFVIPYYLWFLYLAFGILLVVFQKDPTDFFLIGTNLAFGMTLFLFVSWLWPNAIAIRPEVMPRDNIFTALVLKMYAIDTPTNVLPSIHVYNSIGMHLGLRRTKHYQEHRSFRIASGVLSTLIVLSTMFIKQHSVFDVVCGIILQIIVYQFTYGRWNGFVKRTASKIEAAPVIN